jgi:hypothetical protein
MRQYPRFTTTHGDETLVKKEKNDYALDQNLFFFYTSV